MEQQQNDNSHASAQSRAEGANLTDVLCDRKHTKRKNKCSGCWAVAVIFGSSHCAAPKCTKESHNTL